MTWQPATTAAPGKTPTPPAAETPTPNGRTGASLNGPPRGNLPRPSRGKGRFFLILVLGLALAGGAGAAWHYLKGAAGERADIITHHVKRGNLELTIIERGTLESAENVDILCRVKAKSQGSTVATTIKSVIDDGTHVKVGDLLAELDDSGLIEQKKQQQITLDQARAAWVAAEEEYNIQVSQNESDIKNAERQLLLAKIDLEKYIQGDYEQKKKDIQGRLEISRANLEMWRERAGWSERMSKRNFVTAAAAQADRSKLQSAEIDLAKIDEELRVLNHPEFGEYKRQTTDLKGKIDEAERTLDRVKKQAKSQIVTKESNRGSKKSIFEQEKEKLSDIEEEIAKCKLHAPQEGMVVYYIPESSRFGSSRQINIAQGETVTEGQKLMRIPDLSKMLVQAKVHEAMVSRVYAGQPALIKVDAYPDRSLKGRVKSVATVPSKGDWMSSDVQVYLTVISVEETVEGLKPGMSAEVTIMVHNTLENVVTVPVSAVVGNTGSTRNRTVFVVEPDGTIKPREVEVGQSSTRVVEIKKGLDEGDEVVLNPKSLTAEMEKLRSAEASGGDGGAGATPGKFDKSTTVPQKAENGGSDKGSGKKGKGKKGGGGGGPGGPGAGGPGGGGEGGIQMTEDAMKKMQDFNDRMKKATPAERKAMLEQVPENFRDMARQRFKAQGIEIPD